MTRRRFLLLAFLWLALALGAGALTRAVWKQQAERAAVRAQVEKLQAEADALRRAQATVRNDLAQAEDQLARLPVRNAPSPAASTSRAQEIGSWLERVKRLEALFAQRPGQHIPEMQFLTDQDWLRTAKTFPLETEEDVRKALAEIRSRAVNRLASLISPAIRKYVAEHPASRPVMPVTIAGYFEQAVDPLLLLRYEITDRPRNLGSGSDWSIRNREPVDFDYDSRYTINSDGWYSNSGLVAWMPELKERYQRARRSYAQDNPGDTSPNLAKLIPYFDPPLEPQLAERLRPPAAK